MRRCSWLALVLLLIAGLTARADEQDVKAELKKLDGTWAATSGELGGQPVPEDNVKTLTLVMKDGKYTVTVGGETDKGTLKIDPTKKPKTVDVIGTDGPNKGKKFPAIYELDGDTLKVCYDLSEQARPTQFKTAAGTAQALFVFKRQK